MQKSSQELTRIVEQCTHIPVIACDMRGITSHYQEQDIKSESENQVNQLLNYSRKTILLIHVLGTLLGTWTDL